MKLALTFALLCSLAGVARAAGTAYYFPAKVTTESVDGKKNAEAEKADLAAKQAQLQQAQASAKTPKDRDAATALGQRLQQQYQQLQQQNAEQLGARIDRVAATVQKAHKVDLLPVYQGAHVTAASDLTAEIVRRLDAGEGKTYEQKLSELQQKAADRDAQKARADAAEKALAEARKASPAPVTSSPAPSAEESKPVAKR